MKSVNGEESRYGLLWKWAKTNLASNRARRQWGVGSQPASPPDGNTSTAARRTVLGAGACNRCVSGGEPLKRSVGERVCASLLPPCQDDTMEAKGRDVCGGVDRRGEKENRVTSTEYVCVCVCEREKKITVLTEVRYVVPRPAIM
jgi:hypothetical protein